MPSSNILDNEKSCDGNASKSARTKQAKTTKCDKLLKLLRSKRGATIKQLQQASGWQVHSVRGFLSGTVRKKLGHELTSKTDKKGARRYQIVEA
ncbi:MAG: DUF3489 domain-containing protein [Pseudomonadota bacterium]